MNIDRRKSYYLMIDTETCNSYRGDDGKLHLEDSLVYDIGFAVIDKRGHIYEEYSYVLGDIFFNMIDQMNSCYYADKLPQYYADMHSGKRIPDTMWNIKRKIKEICDKYRVKAIVAHNTRFDLNALNNTIRYITASKYRHFLPYGIPIWDTLKMSKVIAQQKTYQRFCENNNYMTNNKPPRPRRTAEILYRYISGDNEFNESHTGLEDVKIEAKIFAHCIRQHKKMDKLLFKPKTT